MKHPLVSIIIPNYNNEILVARCLNSLLNQTYSNIEIVFIDDCSTDRSVEIASSFEKRFDQLKIIQNEVNVGVSVTRNIGLGNATGKYVTTLDSDDEYLPEKVEQEVRVLEENGDNKFVAYSGIIVRNQYTDIMLSPKIGPNDNAYEIVLFRRGVVPRDLMFYKVWVEQVESGFDAKLQKFEDWDFKIRAISEAKLVYAGGPGVIYHQHQNGLSRGNAFNIAYWISVVFLKNYKTSNWVKRYFGLICVFRNMVKQKFKLIR